MKTFSFLVLGLLSVSTFAEEIWCTDQAKWNSVTPDSAYTMRTGANFPDANFQLVDRLFLHVDTLNDKVGITVGKSGSPDSTWSPIASTEGQREVVLRINRNALASKIFLDGNDFPTKKATESKDRYFVRLRKYVEEANGQPLINAFRSKYDELLMIHCKKVP